MIVVVFCVALIFLGYISFCVPIGIIVFNALCVRSQYGKKSLVDSAAHVKDTKIMAPLLEAKERWETKPLKKIRIKAPLNTTKGFSTSSVTLTGDLLLHENFKSNNTIAILAHGFTDSSSGLAYLAESYLEKNISVLAINLRGHGESEGLYSGLGYLLTDGSDISCWVKYIINTYGTGAKIILHGVSMGGSAVIQAAYGYNLPVQLVISDCAFSNYSQNVKNLIQKFFPKNAINYLVIKGTYIVATTMHYLRNGFYFGDNSPEKILLKAKEKGVKIPLVVFHGTADSLVSMQCSKDLYDAAANPKSILLVENAPHIGSWFYEREKYMDLIVSYLRD